MVEGECWEEVERRFPAPPSLSHEEHYSYMLDIAECLRALGYQVPEAPSREAYIDQVVAEDPPTEFWDPYAAASIDFLAALGVTSSGGICARSRANLTDDIDTLPSLRRKVRSFTRRADLLDEADSLLTYLNKIRKLLPRVP